MGNHLLLHIDRHDYLSLNKTTEQISTVLDTIIYGVGFVIFFYNRLEIWLLVYDVSWGEKIVPNKFEKEHIVNQGFQLIAKAYGNVLLSFVKLINKINSELFKFYGIA